LPNILTVADNPDSLAPHPTRLASGLLFTGTDAAPIRKNPSVNSVTSVRVFFLPENTGTCREVGAQERGGRKARTESTELERVFSH
jgi:hypothetical protein